jgi:hypothetical protein
MRSRTSRASEPRLDVRDLGQLLRRELALQRFDRLLQVLGMTPALDHIVGETLCPREGLVRRRPLSGSRSAGLSASLHPRRRHRADQRVGEVAPGIELI